MKKAVCCLILMIIGITATFGQSIDNTWSLRSVADTTRQQHPTQFKEQYLRLDDGQFAFLSDLDSDPNSSGKYLRQNDLLVFFFDTPADSILTFSIDELSDSSLLLDWGGQQLEFDQYLQEMKEILPVETEKELIPSSGVSFQSVSRGALGMVSLILLAFIFSSNRRAIDWKIVGIGLTAQLLLAIGVLQVPFIQNIFEFVGSIFVLILDFTAAGSEFLLGGMMDVESFGFIFLFQVLPTIIFFSALTSVLFYLGVIQVVVKGMAWVLTKLMRISGPESLSVTGNIFLGQTEAPLMIKAYLEKNDPVRNPSCNGRRYGYRSWRGAGCIYRIFGRG